MAAPSPTRRALVASSPALYVVAIAGAALVGLAPVLLPVTEVLIMGVASLILLGALGIASLLRREQAAPTTAHLAPSPASSGQAIRTWDPISVRVARLLFFAGVATVAQATWRPVAGLTVSEIFFIVSFAFVMFAVLCGREIAPLPASLVAGALTFAIGGAISSTGAASPAESATEVLHAVYVMLVWVWTGAMVLQSRRHILTALTLWGASAALNGAAAISQVAGIESLAGPLEGTRATGFTDHANDLGGSAAVALIPCLMLVSRGSAAPGAALVVRWTILALAAIGLVASGSVAAMTAAVIGGILWLTSPSIVGFARLATIGAIFIALAIVVLPGGRIASPSERLTEVTRPGGSGTARLDLVEIAWPRIAEDPIVGAGMGTADRTVKTISGGATQVQQVHGAPLAAWYEAGILGLAGILVVLGSFASVGWRASSTAQSPEDQLIGWSLVAALTAFVVYALSAPLYFHQYGWLAAVLLVAWSAYIRRSRKPPPQAAAY